MSTLHKYLPCLFLFAGSVFLLRGMKSLVSDASAVLPDTLGAAYEHGYALGQAVASISFMVSAAGFFLLGWRRLLAQRNQ
ncbi:hypothetical protein CSC74_12880 [Pseudoxanthomonas yeongjuensis]|jgi:hypothetical protein|uniref:hypothetical protein n=1 Tax=Pseudoxanthomonas yeongjuensis TaxID=377616 RepID=UPI0013919C58|nr:hypothetical protein [Pseudoxanthomonas yeongjuensis]KAF1716052.1 hypothetical protein CSC74_12880 [Pseudoxanthomonas yeongjuensis]